MWCGGDRVVERKACEFFQKKRVCTRLNQYSYCDFFVPIRPGHTACFAQREAHVERCAHVIGGRVGLDSRRRVEQYWRTGAEGMQTF